MTLSWVDPVGRSELGIQEPQHTYSFPLGLTHILGSHLLTDIRSIQAQIHNLLFFRTFGGSDVIREQQIQAIVSKMESNTEILCTIEGHM